MQLKLLLAVCLALLAITAGVADGSARTGWVEGHLSLTFLKVLIWAMKRRDRQLLQRVTLNIR